MENLCPLEEIVFRVSITKNNSIPQDGLDANLVDGLPLFEERGLMLGRVFDHRDRDRSPRDPHNFRLFALSRKTSSGVGSGGFVASGGFTGSAFASAFLGAEGATGLKRSLCSTSFR